MLDSFFSKLIPQAYAQCNPSEEGLNLGDCYTLGVGGQRVSDVYAQPTTLINTVVNALFIAGGFIVFFMIILSGYKFIMGATKGKDEAKQIMTAAVVGLIVMFVAYWVVKVVEILIGMKIVF